MEAWRKELYHYGVSKLHGAPGRGSGRYPLGSGAHPRRVSDFHLAYAKAQQKALNKSVKSGLSERPGEHTIPKGTTMYRTTVNPNEELSGSTYVSITDVDRDHYKAGWIRQTGKSDRAYENEYTLMEDLRVPDRRTQRDVVNQVVNEKPKLAHEVIDSWLKMVMPEGSLTRWELTQNAETDAEKEKIIKDFTKKCLNDFKDSTPNEAYFKTCQSLGLAKETKQRVIDELSKRGYNAMVDVASVGGQNGFLKEGIEPLIVFDSSVLSKNKTTEISRREEDKAGKRYTKWARTARSRNEHWRTPYYLLD